MADRNEQERRIRALHERVWIGYARAIHIRDTMESLLNYPKTHRMPNMAIIGETNNGKTTLLESFWRRHKPSDDPSVEKPQLPVLMVQTPPEPDEARLYNAMLEKLFAAGSAREPADAKLRRLRIILSELSTKMIVLDEFQHALAGNPTKLRRFFNGLKYLGNELQIPLVAVGTPEVLNALQADPQISNRFEPYYLPKWRQGEEFLRLLASVEKVIALQQPSQLHQEAKAARLLQECEGTIGELMKLVRLLAEQAIRSGAECITVEALSDKNLLQLGWRRPSIRSRYVG